MRSNDWAGTTGLGALLIALGIVFFAAQVLGLDVGRYGWPMIIVGAGALMLLMGLSGFDPSRGLVFPGTIVTTVGLILLYQNTTRHWESWAYAWALIPASVGVATMLRALLTRHPRGARRGLSMAAFFLVLFALGFSFFEGVVHISGRDLGFLGQYAFPLLLILTGVWMLVARTMRVEFD
ncbi:MAG: hypothetical protein HYU87_00455 [Chloroflexi bacterium]|nr:hypothetical protein [Chloroflexota bacterium]